MRCAECLAAPKIRVAAMEPRKFREAEAEQKLLACPLYDQHSLALGLQVPQMVWELAAC